LGASEPDLNSKKQIDERPELNNTNGHTSESIYASNIRLVYTPPSSLGLPGAFPKTLQVEGLPLYHASAAFIRHTLTALHTDLHVDLCKLQLRSNGPREKQILVRNIVSGRSRLTKSVNEWDVVSTYTVSPHTGLIDLHTVESIQPAPHITVFDGLRAALARLAGVDLAGPTSTVPSSGSACSQRR